MKGFREYKRWKWHYLLFLEFAKWSSSNSPRLHVQKVAAPRRPHGAAPWVPPLSTALPRSSPTWLGVWARLGHFACFYPQAECAAGSRTTKPLALALCRANKSWHPVDHYWQSCMRWDEAQRREVHSFFIYFILREAEGGVLLIGILDISPSVTCSGTLKHMQSPLFSFYYIIIVLCLILLLNYIFSRQNKEKNKIKCIKSQCCPVHLTLTGWGW